MSIYPDYKSHLLRVGRQRMRTCDPDSVPNIPTPYTPYDEILILERKLNEDGSNKLKNGSFYIDKTKLLLLPPLQAEDMKHSMLTSI
jgi:hypothetical protein